MIELISIGAELLTGQTVNTNGSFIAKTLAKRGFRVQRITTVSDEEKSLKEAVKGALSRAKIVITSGGLGPTGDDITRQVLANLFCRKLIFDPAVAKELKERYGQSLSTLEDQATVIEGATLIPNQTGTAVGFFIQENEQTVIVLPGYPPQMKEMLIEEVLPWLDRKMAPSYFEKTVFLSLISENGVDRELKRFEKICPDVEVGICPSRGVLAIYLKTEAASREEAERKWAPLLKHLQKMFEKHLFSTENREMGCALQKLMVLRKLTLATAESCTGGDLAARLTKISGSSAYFLAGLVAYSNQMKEKLLAVSSKTLQIHGAVSRETVEEMVEGALTVTGADFAIAVSGIAGPTGGTKEKPVGTVWGAIKQRGQRGFTGKIPIRKGWDRASIIEYSSTYLLSHLWRYLQWNLPPFGAS
jgi:nicotinamide-nucleotide amidase